VRAILLALNASSFTMGIFTRLFRGGQEDTATDSEAGRRRMTSSCRSRLHPNDSDETSQDRQDRQDRSSPGARY